MKRNIGEIVALHHAPGRRTQRRVDIINQIGAGLIIGHVLCENLHSRLNPISGPRHLYDQSDILFQASICPIGPATKEQFVILTRRQDRHISRRTHENFTIITQGCEFGRTENNKPLSVILRLRPRQARHPFIQTASQVKTLAGGDIAMNQELPARAQRDLALHFVMHEIAANILTLRIPDHLAATARKQQAAHIQIPLCIQRDRSIHIGKPRIARTHIVFKIAPCAFGHDFGGGIDHDVTFPRLDPYVIASAQVTARLNDLAGRIFGQATDGDTVLARYVDIACAPAPDMALGQEHTRARIFGVKQTKFLLHLPPGGDIAHDLHTPCRRKSHI